MLGAFGGFLGPYTTGRLRDATHSFAGGLYLMSGLALGATILALAARMAQPKVNDSELLPTAANEQ
jgi:cyanate permease